MTSLNGRTRASNGVNAAMTSAGYQFDHFLAAQAGGVYETALAELGAGAKRSHWMWFIFPQLAGLGSSPMARRYALASIEEAAAYAAHDELGERLYESSEAVLDWAGTMSAEDILGSVDALKFRSSMTLFEAACADNQVFSDALDAFYGGERCPFTLGRVAGPGKARAR